MPYTIKDALMGGPGLNGYTYRADTYCVPCGREIICSLFAPPRVINGEISDLAFTDSDALPQPIFFGESDFAQHCGSCGIYLYGTAKQDQTRYADHVKNGAGWKERNK